MAQALTDEQLQLMVDAFKKKRLARPQAAAHNWQKHLEQRVYVNRSVSMDRIKYIGFDMDYTLIVYKSPEYEKLAFQEAVEKLISIGYPPEIAKIQYDPSFPLRGLFFDKLYGNLLKTDQFGNILSCFHGFQSLSTPEMRTFYPNKYVQPDDERIYIFNTLFHLPEIFLLANVINFFDNQPCYKRIEEGPEQYQGVICGDVLISYKMIWQDVRSTFDWVHTKSTMKQKTVDDLERYVKRDPRLPLLLHKLRQRGIKTFIATNSGYEYTQKCMAYLFDFPHGPEPGTPHQDWKSYFDYIIVDAKKPLFFAEGSMLREVDEETGSLKLGVFTGALKKGKVYNGGSSSAFCKYTGARGKEVLYVGDHIFGDVIKAKKAEAWRTFLVLPELTDEVGVWEDTKGLFSRLQNLEYILTEMYTSGNGSAGRLPEIASLRQAIKHCAQEMENAYPSQLGSLLRCGSRQTHFAITASRFADLYSSCCVNLMTYPMNYLFSAPHQLMPHESQPSEILPLSPHPDYISGKLSSKTKIHGALARGMSIIDHDLDEEDGTDRSKLEVIKEVSTIKEQ